MRAFEPVNLGGAVVWVVRYECQASNSDHMEEPI